MWNQFNTDSYQGLIAETIPMTGNICRIDGYLVAKNNPKEITINKLSTTLACLVVSLYWPAWFENNNATMIGGMKNSQLQCI